MLQWNFRKNSEKLCSANGQKWTFLFLVIFRIFWQQSKICSGFSLKNIKKYAVPKSINFRFIFGIFFQKNENC
jgi:hypothetical protein